MVLTEMECRGESRTRGGSGPQVGDVENRVRVLSVVGISWRGWGRWRQPLQMGPGSPRDPDWGCRVGVGVSLTE